MIGGESILCIIPARGGSKRIPRKNLMILEGRPLIAYTIEAGLHSRHIDELLVSTDDLEIANVSRAYGLSVPFMRPSELSQDESSTFGVIQHAIEYYRGHEKKEFTYVMLLQPTSPLRDATEIDKAVEFLMQRRADAVVSVCEVEHSPLWVNTLPEDLSMAGFLRAEVQNRRSQDLEKYYRLNGAVYICRIERLLQERTFFIKDKIFAYVMSQEKSVDVDTMLDLKLCEILLKERIMAAHGQD